MEVEIWSDVVCPWCYLGKRHFEEAASSFEHGDELTVTYRSFELDPFADRGVTTPTVERLAEKYGMTEQDARQAQQQMEQRAAQAGLEFHLDNLRSGNSRASHRLLQLAKTQRLQPEMLERLHRAYFTEHRSIFDTASLTALAADVGLASDEVAAVLASEEYTAEVEADESMARSIGVTGVPFFVIDRKFAISGAQPAAAIVSALDHAWSAVGQDA
jgi:predicted DsbA family dithiol-disulfide isomerase